MPERSLHPCSKPRCSELTRNQYCEEHTGVYKSPYNHRWQKARLRFLRKNPLCVRCENEGVIVAANVVDHIIPHEGNMDIFWNVEMWQPLCKRHHDIKTNTEDGGFNSRR